MNTVSLTSTLPSSILSIRLSHRGLSAPTSRLTLISKYLQAIGITNFLADRFPFLKKSSKGTPPASVFHQLLCFFFDGTNVRLTRFDHLKQDEGYAAGIETPREQMLSSQSVERFFQYVSIDRVWLFRRILHRLFAWRLSLEQPDRILLGIDTIFRSGKVLSSYGEHVVRMLSVIDLLIRTSCRSEVLIVVAADSEFYNQKLLEHCQKLNIGIVGGGSFRAFATVELTSFGKGGILSNPIRSTCSALVIPRASSFLVCSGVTPRNSFNLKALCFLAVMV